MGLFDNSKRRTYNLEDNALDTQDDCTASTKMLPDKEIPLNGMGGNHTNDINNKDSSSSIIEQQSHLAKANGAKVEITNDALEHNNGLISNGVTNDDVKATTDAKDIKFELKNMNGGLDIDLENMSSEVTIENAYDKNIRHRKKKNENDEENKEDEKNDEDEEDGDVVLQDTLFSNVVSKIETRIELFCSKHKRMLTWLLYAVLLSVYMTYFIYCMNYRFGDEGSMVLLVVTILVAVKIMFRVLENNGIFIGLPKGFYMAVGSPKGMRIRSGLRYFAYIAACIFIVLYLAIDVFPDNSANLQSFLGMLVMIFLCFLMSANPSQVRWYPVFWSLVIQFAVATWTLRTETGYRVFKWLGDAFTTVVGFSDAGSILIISKDFKDHGLSMSSTGVIIFVNSLIFLLNYWGAIEFIVLKLGRFFAFCLETGPVESVVAAANIFIGLAEAPLMIRPYLPTVTRSELHTIMTCGYASISGGVMILFINFGAPANHLLTASVISAPAALAISKLMYPETQKICLNSQKNIALRDNSDCNAMSAFSEGAVMALYVAASIWANMLTFVSMMDLLDNLAIWLGARAGVEGMDFQMICSYVLFPIAYAMGVNLSDCRPIGKLIGIKLVATPYVAYGILGDLIDNRMTLEAYTAESSNNTWRWDGDDIFLEANNVTLAGGVLLERTEVIASYAMCGLSAFAAIGISLGALLSLCKERKKDIIDLVLRAFVAGNVACFLTGCVAGILHDPARIGR